MQHVLAKQNHVVAGFSMWYLVLICWRFTMFIGQLTACLAKCISQLFILTKAFLEDNS